MCGVAQRLPRYLLLLRELKKYSQEDDPALDDIKAAEAKISAMADGINNQLKEAARQVHRDLPEKIQTTKEKMFYFIFRGYT